MDFEDRLEFLDCSDFNSFLVAWPDIFSAAQKRSEKKPRGKVSSLTDDSWPATKASLHKLAKLPVSSFLKSPRTPSLVFDPWNCICISEIVSFLNLSLLLFFLQVNSSFYFHFYFLLFFYIITYLPHKAVAEVSKDKEPIGRECAEFNWFESQLMSDSIEVRFK